MRPVFDAAAIAVVISFAGPALAQSQSSAAGETHAAPPTAKAAGLRLLSWPGKVIPRTAPPPADDPPAPRPAPVSIYDPPASAPAPASSPRPPAPPAAAQPQIRAVALASPPTSTTARLYSVHRPYGDAPDPITLSPQFMNDATPDLAAPPPPVLRPVTTASGQVVRAAPDDAGSASSPSSTP